MVVVCGGVGVSEEYGELCAAGWQREVGRRSMTGSVEVVVGVVTFFFEELPASSTGTATASGGCAYLGFFINVPFCKSSIAV